MAAAVLHIYLHPHQVPRYRLRAMEQQQQQQQQTLP
jgi:hypothetical protein